MIEVYFYIPVNEVDNAVECGLKLSQWHNREVFIGGDLKRCISTLLNPRDDMKRYRSDHFRCLKLELPPARCYAADSCLYSIGSNHAEVMRLYMKSIIPLSEYGFGTYRLPECLVTTTVLPDQISILKKGLDSPILFANSEELYINNVIEAYRESHDHFNDTMLYCFYSRLADQGWMAKIEDVESRMAVFTGRGAGDTVTLRIPDIAEYSVCEQGTDG